MKNKPTEIRLELNDIYAVDVVTSVNTDSAVLNIYSFAKEGIKAKNCCGCTQSQVLTKRVLRQKSLLSNSVIVAHEWQRRLFWALDNKIYQDDCDPKKRKLLILLNPFGGAGAARRNWAVVEPYFQKAHLDYQLVETQHAGHAYEIVNTELVAGQFDVIITVSGDGLLHEVINGLLNRKDWN